MNLNKEPVLIIGTIVTVIIGAISTLSGNGLISDVAAGRATDVVKGIGDLLTLLAPLIAAALTRGKVFSPATTQVVANNAAATGDSTITVTPP